MDGHDWLRERTAAMMAEEFAVGKQGAGEQIAEEWNSRALAKIHANGRWRLFNATLGDRTDSIVVRTVRYAADRNGKIGFLPDDLYIWVED